MVPDKPQKVENFHFTWCGYIGFRTRLYVKTLALFRGGGVKNLPHLPTGNSTADGRGVGVKNCEKFTDVLNGWSLM